MWGSCMNVSLQQSQNRIYGWRQRIWEQSKLQQVTSMYLATKQNVPEDFKTFKEGEDIQWSQRHCADFHNLYLLPSITFLSLFDTKQSFQRLWRSSFLFCKWNQNEEQSSVIWFINNWLVINIPKHNSRQNMNNGDGGKESNCENISIKWNNRAEHKGNVSLKSILD